jgi:hypothetical protein
VKRTYLHGALITSKDFHWKRFPVPYYRPTPFIVVQTDSLAAALKKKEGKKEGRKEERQKEIKKKERKILSTC